MWKTSISRTALVLWSGPSAYEVMNHMLQNLNASYRVIRYYFPQNCDVDWEDESKAKTA